MTEKDIKEMRRKLDEQYKKDWETLDRMLELLKRGKDGTSVTMGGKPETEPQPTIIERIESFVSSTEGNFTRKSLKALIKEQDPVFFSELKEQAISTALRQLKKTNKIRVVIPKVGSGAAIYAKP